MDLQQFKRKVARNKKGLTKFLKRLDEKVPEDFNPLVNEVNKTVWRDVDCLSCANCCKTMTPTWTSKDVRRTADHLGITPEEFRSRWLYKEKETGDWMNRTTPCQFLDLNTNMCSVYEVRPADCRGFPHHTKKPFDLYNDMYIANIEHCPATFLFISRIKKRVEQEYEWD